MAIESSASILRESWWPCKVIDLRIPTGAMDATRKWVTRDIESGIVGEHSDRFTEALFIMDCRGVGKTSALIDAIKGSGWLHVYVNVLLFDGLVEVGPRAREFYVNKPLLCRGEVLKGYQALFESKLADMLQGVCKRLCAPTGGITFAGPSSTGASSLRDAWVKLLKKVDQNSSRVLLHFDAVESIFDSPDQRIPDEDLLGGDDDVFDVHSARRLIFKAFLSALAPLIHSEPRIRWVFSGLPPNLTPMLNAPAGLRVVDLTPSFTYFEPADMYQVFLSHINPLQPAQPAVFESASEKMKFCMRQLAGPPRMMQCFFSALHMEKIGSIDQMCLQWEAVERMTVACLGQLLRFLDYYRREDLKRCLLVPFRERLFGERISIDRSNGYWNEMIVKGLIRLSRDESRKNPRDGNRYVFSLPYLFLQKALCSKLNVSRLVIHALTNLAVCLECTPTAYLKDRMLETLFVASLVEYASNTVSDWLMHKLNISNCFPPTCDLMSSLMEGLGDGVSVDGSADKVSEMPRMEFEASVGQRMPAEYRERACVAVHTTLCSDLCIGDVESGYQLGSIPSSLDCISRMVRSAVERFEKTHKRALIVVAGPNLPKLSQRTNEQVFLAMRSVFHTRLDPEYEQLKIELKVDRPLTRLPCTGVWDCSVPPLAIMYIPGSDPIWQHMSLPLVAMQQADTDEVRRFIIQRFISSVGSGVSFNENDRSLEADMAREWAKKRKANHLDDICQSLRECRIVCEEQIRIFQQKMSVRSVMSLEAFTKELLVAEGVDDTCAELISEHILRFFDPRLPLRFGNDHDNDQP